jgi:hypothetical protein
MTKRKLLRIKLEGCEIFEIYTDSICGFDILFSEETESYILSITTSYSQFSICEGNFDKCHSKLNNIHKYLEKDEQIINLQ